MRKHLPSVTPPTAVLYAVLEEAHTEGKDDARRTTPYTTWQMDRGNLPRKDETPKVPSVGQRDIRQLVSVLRRRNPQYSKAADFM